MDQVLGKIEALDQDQSLKLVSIITERNQQLATENRRLRAEIVQLRKALSAARNTGIKEGLSRASCRPGFADMGG